MYALVSELKTTVVFIYQRQDSSGSGSVPVKFYRHNSSSTTNVCSLSFLLLPKLHDLFTRCKTFNMRNRESSSMDLPAFVESRPDFIGAIVRNLVLSDTWPSSRSLIGGEPNEVTRDWRRKRGEKEHGLTARAGVWVNISHCWDVGGHCGGIVSDHQRAVLCKTMCTETDTLHSTPSQQCLIETSLNHCLCYSRISHHFQRLSASRTSDRPTNRPLNRPLNMWPYRIAPYTDTSVYPTLGLRTLTRPATKDRYVSWLRKSGNQEKRERGGV